MKLSFLLKQPKSQTKCSSKSLNLGHFLGKIITPLCQKRGLISVDLVLEWQQIVGRDIAKACQVLKISFPGFSRQQGCLHLQTDSAMAMALTYSRPMIIERVNQYYGYQAIHYIRVFHKPYLAKNVERPSIPQQIARLPLEWQNLTQSVADKNLRQALEGLAHGLQSKAQKTI